MARSAGVGGAFRAREETDRLPIQLERVDLWSRRLPQLLHPVNVWRPATYGLPRLGGARFAMLPEPCPHLEVEQRTEVSTFEGPIVRLIDSRAS